MSKVTKLKLPKRGEIHHYLVASDWHSHFLNADCYSILKKHAKLLPKKSRKLIILGDFLDAWYCMGKNELFKTYIKRASGVDEFFLPHYQKEILWANEKLDELQKIFPEIIFVHGNHDQPRFDFLCSKLPPSLAYNFDMNRDLGFIKRKIKTINYNDWLDIGKPDSAKGISLTHGMFHGSTCLKKHYEACHRSVIFGHVHKDEKKTFISRGESRQAHSLPAMCDLAPDYMRNSDSDWTNGYGYLGVRNDGCYQFHTCNMWSKALMLPGGKVIHA